MATIETRLARLEIAKRAPTREYSDAERAVRYAYLLEQGGPDADKVRAILAQSDANRGCSHE
jgi:hypothetical protein